MPQSRMSGLLLIVMGALTFLGTTNQLLPAVAFFPGLFVCVLGVFVFLKANHEALQGADRRIQERLHPVIKSPPEGLAAGRPGAGVDSLEDGPERDRRMPGQAATVHRVGSREVATHATGVHDDAGEVEVVGTLEGDEGAEATEPGFVVESDVSFPLELQQHTSLADQLAKLRRLADDGIISEAEFAVAKAKLLA